VLVDETAQAAMMALCATKKHVSHKAHAIAHWHGNIVIARNTVLGYRKIAIFANRGLGPVQLTLTRFGA
jgi:hypothetical protein